MRKMDTLSKIKNGLIVSCQARPGWAMHGPEIMAAFAVAAKQGGACAIRATGRDNINAIKEKVDLPIIGINKIFDPRYDVYITPTFESAEEILELGVDIIALDATSRKRPNGEIVSEIITQIRHEYPSTLIMAEISTIDEAFTALTYDIDLISTTLSGYTKESENIHHVNIDLIRDIVAITDIPVIAEGKIETIDEAISALEAGAFSVVVGTSITRPEIITSRYVNALDSYKGPNL
ncbi:N-acetylmannosamine-6-phosphate 2-epimerase [Erysipelothrix aquatica]|uniref:N-acetylmannosamine-6-phosphate 2-epimerase n=1 Tax=Erysipelothrix aquatica TaxID=2683714 RepID=UPI00135C9AFF|nr:N-acetylmannosamine-6-phosphate 2-epimerase [Erysipelothrix aquatica]